MLGSGVMNIIPWGGPTARVLASLKLDTSEVFTPLIPAMIAGILWVIAVAYTIAIPAGPSTRSICAGESPAAASRSRRAAWLLRLPSAPT